MKVGFIYDDVFLRHETPYGHPECADRLKSIVHAVKGSPLQDNIVYIKPRKASFDDIQLVHTTDYVNEIRNFGQGYIDPDTYISEGSLDAALFAAGAVVEAVDRCNRRELRRLFCAVRPPGHHAEADRAMGFCIFNNVAIGARYAQKSGFNRVFIVDFDVHHGNGTQHIFEDDDTVFYFSTHQFPYYPGTGSGSEHGRGKGRDFTYNIQMRSGSGDKEYFYAYNDILPGIFRSFDPDIILVSAGYDLHRDDPLASLKVSDEGIGIIVRSILSSGKPAIFSLEGGYDLGALAESVLITLGEMIKD